MIQRKKMNRNGPAGWSSCIRYNGQSRLHSDSDQKLEGGKVISCGQECFPWI